MRRDRIGLRKALDLRGIYCTIARFTEVGLSCCSEATGRIGWGVRAWQGMKKLGSGRTAYFFSRNPEFLDQGMCA